jgi:hypothetical protein
MITVPKEFKDLCLQFQLANLAYHGSVEAMIASAVSKLSDQKREVIDDFLSDLLSGKHGSKTIKAVWNGTPADFFIRDDQQLAAFLKLIREQIQNPRDLSRKPPA